MKHSHFLMIAIGFISIISAISFWSGHSETLSTEQFAASAEAASSTLQLSSARRMADSSESFRQDLYAELGTIKKELAALRSAQKELAGKQDAFRKEQVHTDAEMDELFRALADLNLELDSGRSNELGLDPFDAPQDPPNAEDIRRLLDEQWATLEGRISSEAEDVDESAVVQQAVIESADSFFPDSAPKIAAQCGNSLCRVEFTLLDQQAREEVLASVPLFIPRQTQVYMQADPDHPEVVVAYFTRDNGNLP